MKHYFNFKLAILLMAILVVGISPRAFSQDNNIIVTHKNNTDNSIDFYYKKKLPGSFYIELTFNSIENSHQRTVKKVIKYNSGNLLRIRPIDKNKPINFSYRYDYIRGKPNPKFDKNFIYVLPFKIGKLVKIIETNSLSEKYFNAEKDHNWKSFMVDRKTPDTIYNMRKGIVIEIIKKFEADTSKPYNYTSKMNKVIIEHKDGTFATYTGFNKKSIFVKLGQTVYPQTKLGVLDIFNNAVYRLYFDVSYLNSVDFNKKLNLTSKSRLTHITPYFYSSNEPLLLKHNNEYTVEINKKVLLKEFTRREKRRYRKNKL